MVKVSGSTVRADNPSTKPEPVKLFISASCDTRTGQGGWGLYVPKRPKPIRDFGIAENTTSNALGLIAINHVLDNANGDRELMFVCSNAYIVDNFHHSLPVWAENGWRNSESASVANKGLWEKLHEARNARAFSLLHPEEDEVDQLEEAKRLAVRGLRQCRRIAA